VIIVTGASGGLGRGLVENLRDADSVVGTYYSQKPVVEHDAIRWMRVNVADPESVAQFAHEIDDDASRITLVNLAGISLNRLALQMSSSDWDAVLNTNLRGSFLMSQALLRHMIRDRWGRIIHISSIVAEKGVPGTCAYAASKAGLMGLSRALAKEYARFGITSNCLVLGYFQEGLTKTLPTEQRQAVLEDIPLRRFGLSHELASAVRYLMEATYTTGECIHVDGGLP
jgi:3-oxoacyl-[acyl-carrier protein] reductase